MEYVIYCLFNKCGSVSNKYNAAATSLYEDWTIERPTFGMDINTAFQQLEDYTIHHPKCGCKWEVVECATK